MSLYCCTCAVESAVEGLRDECQENRTCVCFPRSLVFFPPLPFSGFSFPPCQLVAVGGEALWEVVGCLGGGGRGSTLHKTMTIPKQKTCGGKEEELLFPIKPQWDRNRFLPAQLVF